MQAIDECKEVPTEIEVALKSDKTFKDNPEQMFAICELFCTFGSLNR